MTLAGEACHSMQSLVDPMIIANVPPFPESPPRPSSTCVQACATDAAPAPDVHTDIVALSTRGMVLLAEAFRYRSLLRLGMYTWRKRARSSAMKIAELRACLQGWRKVAEVKKRKHAIAARAAEASFKQQNRQCKVLAFSRWFKSCRCIATIRAAERSCKQCCFAAWQQRATLQTSARAHAEGLMCVAAVEAERKRKGLILHAWHLSWKRSRFVRQAGLAITMHDKTSALAAWRQAAKASMKRQTQWLLQVEEFRRRRRRIHCSLAFRTWCTMLNDLHAASRARLLDIFAFWRLWIQEQALLRQYLRECVAETRRALSPDAARDTVGYVEFERVYGAMADRCWDVTGHGESDE